jgi:pilus assembly protein CpaB
MRRPTVFVVLALVAATLAAVVVYRALKSREAELAKAKAQTVEVVVAAKDLPLGTKLQQSDLKMARWSSEALPAGAFRDRAQAVDHYVKSSFVTNEPIVPSKLYMGEKTAGVLPLLIPVGMRAVSVAVDEVSDIAGFVLPRTRVDVVVAVQSRAEGEKPFSKIVLQNIEVLAVAQEVELERDEPKVVKVVTLLVTPEEAERLALASREGSLRLAMRNFQDNKIVLTAGTDVQQMLRAYGTAPAPVVRAQTARGAVAAPRVRPFEVEVMRDGKSSESISFVQEAAVRSEAPGASKRTVSAAPKPSGAAESASAATPAQPAPAAEEKAAASAPAALSAPMAPIAEALMPQAPPASGASTTRPGVIDATVVVNKNATVTRERPVPKTIDVP